ncbi:MAG: tRNA pseudouridine(38-40) synthase TruA [Flavobacteriales bacterium]|nr:tRNA pseudouridine(38-40) synthase TruA [Flavobacteriales bacterium]
MRYFIHLSYKGTAYNGWQSQPEGQGKGVQQVVERGLSTILRTTVEIVGAGRTDTGVHARNMYAHIDLEKEIVKEDNIIGRLNSILPKDIAILDIFPVKDTAHARFDATLREYVYHIHTFKDPFIESSSYLFFHSLNIEAMNRACDIMMRYTDFQCFSKVKTDVKTFICHISHARWEDTGDGHLKFTIRADRFLRNMVRAIVGTMIDIGRGKILPEDIASIIESHSRCKSGMSAPAHGLTLNKVEYDWDNILIKK